MLCETSLSLNVYSTCLFWKVREAMEAISENSRPDVELILSGTTLLTPDDMFNLMLGSSDSM